MTESGLVTPQINGSPIVIYNRRSLGRRGETLPRMPRAHMLAAMIEHTRFHTDALCRWLLLAAMMTGLASCKSTREALKTIELPKQAAPIARGAPSPAPQPLPIAPVAQNRPSKPTAPKAALTSKAAQRKAARARARKLAAKVVPLESIKLPIGAVHGVAPRTSYPLMAVFARIRQIASVGEVRMILPWLTLATRQRLMRSHKAQAVLPMAPRTLWQRLTGPVLAVHYEGHRAMVTVGGKRGEHTLIFFVEDAGWRLDLPHQVQKTQHKAPEPIIDLNTATKGVTGQGPLVAVFDTTSGRFRCKLHEGMVPKTVAHFVALARGLIGPLGRSGNAKPFYDGLRIHRARANQFIQSGDPSELGTGGAGFTVADEFHHKLHHNRPGVLSLASAGPHSASSQFFITLQAAPTLDGRHNIFGQCKDIEVIRAISTQAPRTVVVKQVRIQRDF